MSTSRGLGSSRQQMSLTDELNALDQSITLTLQEIDHKFAKTLRVAERVLGVVEQYGKGCEQVWEGSKFWKQFFEASANVSLSGYEEGPALLDNETTVTENEETSTDLHTPSGLDYDDQSAREAEDTVKGSALEHTNNSEKDDRDSSFDQEESEFDMSSPTQVTGVVSTPKLPVSGSRGSTNQTRGSVNRTRGAAPSRRTPGTSAKSFRSPSPRKYTGRNPIGSGRRGAAEQEPFTPNAGKGGGFVSSPFEPESAFQPSTATRNVFASAGRGKENADPVMHRSILDKTYRVQATPMTQRPERPHDKATPGTTTRTTTSRQLWDESPESSPEVERPQLRSDLFSPGKGSRTPGISILTPARGKVQQAAAPTTSTGRRLFTPGAREGNQATPGHTSRIFSDEEDDSDEIDFDISPPKTMQFHVPQSRLMQTPAREASRKIVEDLLLTAGADGTTDIEEQDDGIEEPSPSIVRKAYEEDTF